MILAEHFGCLDRAWFAVVEQFSIKQPRMGDRPSRPSRPKEETPEWP